MGIELVKAVTAKCGHLKGNEYKVLVYMAACALDRPNDRGQQAALYFAGWEPLAIALGHFDTTGRYELVRRALQGLVDAGQVERLQDHPRHGVRQTFRVTPRSPHETWGLEPPQNVGAPPLQNVGAKPPQNVVRSPHETWGPRTEEDSPADLDQDVRTRHPAQPSEGASSTEPMDGGSAA